MNIALVQELLTMRGGAERMFKVVSEMFPEAPIYTLLYNEKKLGQKTGEGFYKYSGDKYARIPLSEELAEKCNPIQIFANILNNAAWLVTKEASDIQEIEKAAKLGLGLKKPLFDTAKEFGMSNIVNELKTLAEKHGQFYEPDPLLVSMQ